MQQGPCGLRLSESNGSLPTPPPLFFSVIPCDRVVPNKRRARTLSIFFVVCWWMWRPWFITVQPARSTGRRRSPFPVRPFLLHYHQRFSSFTSSPLFRLLACVVHIPWPVYSIFVIRLSFLFFYTYAVLFHSSFPIRHAFGVSDSPKTHPSFLVLPFCSH